MKGQIVLVLISFLTFLACSDDPTKKAKSLIEIGDYSSAITSLSEVLEKEPKNIEARRLLAQCYELTEQWEKQIEQYLVLSKLEPSVSNNYKLMRLYAQTNQFDKLLELNNVTESPDKLLEKLLSKETAIFRKQKAHLLDSLGVAEDSLYNHPFYIDLERKFQKLFESIRDSLSVADYYTAIGLHELHENKKYSITRTFELILEIDSAYVKYIRKPILTYIENLKKPEPSIFLSDFYYGDRQEYHELRGELYELIGLYDKALDEYDNLIYWFSQDPKKDSGFAWMKYDKKIKLLLKLGRYKQAIDEAKHLLSLYGKKDQLTKTTAELYILQAEEKLRSRNAENKPSAAKDQ